MQMGSSMSTAAAPSNNTRAMPQTQRGLHFLRFPPEIRTEIYREALITPSPNVVLSFVPPPLLQTCKAIRQEATPMFYANNHFEITLKRAPEHQVLYTHYRMTNIDKFAWDRFWTMWAEFSSTGTNVLQYITRITLIYELSMDTGFGFGEDAYDRRIGLRFLGGTRDEDQDATYVEPGDEVDMEANKSDSDCDSDCDSYTYYIGSEEYEYRELDAAEIHDLYDELDGLDDEADEQRYMPVSMAPINAPPAPDVDVLGVYELITKGYFTWINRAQTYDFLYRRVKAYESDNLWKVYPCQRLAEMMWRGGTDCPLAAQSVDFICEDYQHWMNGDRPYRIFDEKRLYNPDENEE